MNRNLSSSSLDALETRFGMAVAARLSEGAQQLPSDLSERLRFAREQALERGRAARRAEAAVAPQSARTVVGATTGGALMLGGGPSWWFRLAATLPVLALVAGLVMIEKGQNSAEIAEAAEVDAALLSDDLPPNAYSDAGFAEFLKTPPRE